MRLVAFLIISLLAQIPAFAYPSDPAEHTRLVQAADREILSAQNAMQLARRAEPINEADLAAKLDRYAWLCVLQRELGMRSPMYPELLPVLRDRRIEGKTLFEQALAIRERLYGPRSPEVQETLSHFGYYWANAYEFADAELLLERAIEIGESGVGSQGPLVEALKAMARVRENKKMIAAANELRVAALRIESMMARPHDWRYEHSIQAIALNYATLKKFPEAEQYFRLYLEELERNPESDKYDIHRALNNLTASQLNQDEFARAESTLSRAIEVGKTLSPKALGLNDTRAMAKTLAEQKRKAE